MVKRKICRKCGHWRQRGGVLGPHCGYMEDTGRSRIAQMTEAQRKSRECPFFEAGPPKKVLHKPIVVSPNRLARLTEGRMFRSRPRLDYDRMLTLYDQGKSDQEIADEMNCAKETVRGWRARRELPPNVNMPRKRVDTEKVRALYMAGFSDRRIADMVGCSSNAVLDWRHREKLPPNYQPGKRTPHPSPACGDETPSPQGEGTRGGDNE